MRGTQPQVSNSKKVKNHADRAYRLKLNHNFEKLYTIAVDNKLNRFDCKTRQVEASFPDFYTFDFDSAFDLERHKEFVVGSTNKHGKHFGRRVTKRRRCYTLLSSKAESSHTCAVSCVNNRVFYGYSSSHILGFSLHSGKCTTNLWNFGESKRINSLLMDSKARLLFVGVGSSKLKIVSLTRRGFPVIREFKYGSEVIHLKLSPSQRWLSIGLFTYNSNSKYISLVDISPLLKS